MHIQCKYSMADQQPEVTMVCALHLETHMEDLLGCVCGGLEECFPTPSHSSPSQPQQVSKPGLLLWLPLLFTVSGGGVCVCSQAFNLKRGITAIATWELVYRKCSLVGQGKIMSH